MLATASLSSHIFANLLDLSVSAKYIKIIHCECKLVHFFLYICLLLLYLFLSYVLYAYKFVMIMFLSILKFFTSLNAFLFKFYLIGVNIDVNKYRNQPWTLFGRADAEVPILWPPDANSWLTLKDPDAGKDWGQKEKGATGDEMVGWHHRFNGHGLGQTLGDGEGQGSLASCSFLGHKELGMTCWLNNSNIEIGFPVSASCRESACRCRPCKRCGFYPRVRKVPWGRKWQCTPVFLLGKFRGQRVLVGYSPRSHKESDTTERLNTILMSTFYFVE